jgi:hypothetical protein
LKGFVGEVMPWREQKPAEVLNRSHRLRKPGVAVWCHHKDQSEKKTPSALRGQLGKLACDRA